MARGIVALNTSTVYMVQVMEKYKPGTYIMTDDYRERRSRVPGLLSYYQRQDASGTRVTHRRGKHIVPRRRQRPRRLMRPIEPG